MRNVGQVCVSGNTYEVAYETDSDYCLPGTVQGALRLTDVTNSLTEPSYPVLLQCMLNRWIIKVNFQDGTEEVSATGVVGSYARIEGIAFLCLENFYRPIAIARIRDFEVRSSL